MCLVPTYRVADIQRIFCEIKTVAGFKVGDAHADEGLLKNTGLYYRNTGKQGLMLAGFHSKF